MSHTALLRLLQLASPTLPVGAYSYSEGLETLVESGTVQDATTLNHWLIQELQLGAVRVEAAIAVRVYTAMIQQNQSQLHYWNQWLSAWRETEELRLQSWQMGRSLLRLFADLYPQTEASQPDSKFFLDTVDQVLQQQGCNFAIAFAIVAAHWQLEPAWLVLAYLHSWANNLVSAGVKLIPLGQTAGQQLLLALHPALEVAQQEILALPDDQLDSCGWGLSLASMKHETQYSRLFRS